MRNVVFAAAFFVLACSPATGSQAPTPKVASTGDSAKSKDSKDSTTTAGRGALSEPFADPFPSTYKPFPSKTTVIRNVTILTAAGPRITNGAILLEDGKIQSVGASVNAPADAVVIDGKGKFVTPGIIDIHSHLGVYSAPGVEANSDGNEATRPVTAYVWAEHSVWPQDPQFPRNLAGGVTTLQVLPGSANLFGGRSVVLKVVPSRTVQGMKFPGAKYGLEDGVRRKSEARLREQGRSADPHGQRRRLSNGVDRGRAVPPQVGQVERRQEGRSAGARSRIWRRSPRCCAGTSSCTTTVTAPTRWRR